MTSKVIQTFTGNDVYYKVIKDGYKTITETIHVTDSMPTRTVYDLEPSSVVHDPDLDYTIDTSHDCPPLIIFNTLKAGRRPFRLRRRTSEPSAGRR